jgi:flavin-dependent thymidylate synthase
MMKVQLIDFTGAGHENPARYAAERLVFTKQTRLNMDGYQLGRVQAMSDDELGAELDYMANTIPSSWEFIDYTFLINGVSRAFTHQFVRTRTGSYAQQTMRVLDVEGWDYLAGPSIMDDPQRAELYDNGMEAVDRVYRELIEGGAKIEDARGILPTNILTNIVAKFNLRTLADTARKRASTRTQGEYRDVMDAMINEVVTVHPWAHKFVHRTFDVAAYDLEHLLLAALPPSEHRTHMIKLIDQMRATA